MPLDSAISPAASSSCPHCLSPLDPLAAPELRPIARDLLTTNRPPHDPEILCIQSAITEQHAQKTRLDARISALQESLTKLLADRDSLEEKIRDHQGTLSPLRRMPTELLSLIFTFTFSSNIREGDAVLWNVGQVCRLWRAIVSSQPSFWTSIILDFGQSVVCRTATKYRLETRLQRSGDLSLDITFTCESRFDEYTAQELVSVKTLAKHCARWRKMSYSGPFQLYSELACIRGHLPLLQELKVISYLDRDEEPSSTDFFELAPNLQRVSMNIFGRAATVMLPFSQLQQYIVHTWNYHPDTLHSASNLVECVLEASSISMPPAAIILLPQLLRLCLSTSNLLEYLDTPNLQELYCSSRDDYLSSLFGRRPYRLQKLVLLSPASVPDLRGILHSVRTITDIGLFIPTESLDTLAGLLTIRNDTTDVGPDLGSIIICSESLFGGLKKGLVDMVESRWLGGAGQLRSVVVPTGMSFFLSSNTRLELFESQGLEIKFSGRVGSGYILGMIPPHLRLDYNHYGL
ncbi:hypothetical protein C8R44DRAFT_673830 [Mycena epipterygia]|nr:hypothetical protein C8R44DRAFT_673830 [Mycena epipterygia]